jgi:hypothetical protein
VLANLFAQMLVYPLQLTDKLAEKLVEPLNIFLFVNGAGLNLFGQSHFWWFAVSWLVGWGGNVTVDEAISINGWIGRTSPSCI